MIYHISKQLEEKWSIVDEQYGTWKFGKHRLSCLTLAIKFV